MKIAFDHQIFCTQTYGGISRYYFELARHLASWQVEVEDVCIVSPLYKNEYLTQATSPLKLLGIKAPSIPRTGRLYSTINDLLFKSILDRLKPDILHETYYTAKSKTDRKKCKTVITVYDMIHELYANHFPAGDRTRHIKRHAVQRADHIICISEHTRQDLVRLLGVDPSRTSVVHLGFSLTAQASTNPISRKPYLLYVGQRSGYKNFKKLLHAYASSVSLRKSFDLIAFGGGVFSSDEYALIQKLGLNKSQVIQYGGGDNILASLYKNAAIFVYPSLYEGFGIPPLEAMSFDCPVACSNTSSLPEVLGNAAVFFDPELFESIANTIELVLTDEVLAQSLVQRGRELIINFSWERCAQQTLDVYRRLVE